MKRFLVIIFVVLTSSTYGQTFKVSSVFNQTPKNGVIKGMVLNLEANNEPLAFSTVTVKETNTSTTTNIDGTFTLNLKPGVYTLIYNFVGYETVEVENVKVTLDEAIICQQQLNALVPELPILVSEVK